MYHRHPVPFSPETATLWLASLGARACAFVWGRRWLFGSFVTDDYNGSVGLVRPPIISTTAVTVEHKRAALFRSAFFIRKTESDASATSIFGYRATPLFLVTIDAAPAEAHVTTAVLFVYIKTVPTVCVRA